MSSIKEKDNDSDGNSAWILAWLIKAEGEQTQKKDETGFKLFQESAEKGNIEAQRDLGFCYFFGDGCPKNDGKAFQWFLKSAEQGDVTAQGQVGRFYAKGMEVKKNDSMAVSWFFKAAEQGCEFSQFRLGEFYAKGYGVPKDDVEAYAFFNLAGASFEKARDAREKLAESMTRSQIASAQKRSKKLLSTGRLAGGSGNSKKTG